MASSSRYFLLLLMTIAAFSQYHCIYKGSPKRGRMEKLSAPNSVRLQTDPLAGKKSCGADTDCPLWAYCNESYCACRASLEHNYRVKCSRNNVQLSVRRCSCVTYSNETGVLTGGDCIETCGSTFNDHQLYFPLPSSPSEMNQYLCEDKWNRTGRLCGKCLPGHAPLAFSYDMSCISCPEGNKNFWKYLLIMFVPLTLFYFLILFFKINTTSSHLHGYLYFAQAISIPLLVRAAYVQQKGLNQKLPFNILIAFYSIWTLDILRSLHPDICLDVSTLTLFAMDYALALYPLLLTLLSYILIELYDRNYRVVVCLWQPFRCVFTLVRTNWNVRTTVIDAYTTFFLLLFVKVLYTSFDILSPTAAADLTSGNITWVLYYDGTVDYFGAEHLPYAILAVVMCTMFTIAPAFLFVLYPFRWFQRLLTCLKLQGSLLRTVMDSFQGWYKDGTEPGARDCRWFAAVPLIVRFMGLFFSAFGMDSSIFPWANAVAISGLIFTIIIQPYRTRVAFYTKRDAIFLGMLTIFLALVNAKNLAGLIHPTLRRVDAILLQISAVIPLLYMACIALYWIFSRMKKRAQCFSYLKGRIAGYDRIEEKTISDDDIPDRLANPQQYASNSLQDAASNKFITIQDRNSY